MRGTTRPGEVSQAFRAAAYTETARFVHARTALVVFETSAVCFLERVERDAFRPETSIFRAREGRKCLAFPFRT
jgi:hypothetical protein